MKKIASIFSCVLFMSVLTCMPQAKTKADWHSSQLSQTGQQVYEDFRKDIQELKTTADSKFEKGKDKDAMESFESILWLLKKQNPDIFWLSYDSQTCTIEGGSNVIQFRPIFMDEFVRDGKLDREFIQQQQAQLKATAKSIEKGDDTFDTLKKYNAWICENIQYSYQYQNPRSYEITGSLIDRKAACEGFAKAFKYLCNQAGIECINVSGKGILNGKVYDHEWNYVHMPDKQWYLVDTTWNALSADNEKWFLCSLSDNIDGMSILRSHAPDNHAYPFLSEDNYPNN